MARRKKSDGSTPTKPINPIAVRKSSRQIARKQSLDGNKVNGEVLHPPNSPEIQNPAPEETPKSPEVVVKRKRGRPRLSVPKESKNVIQQASVASKGVNNVGEDSRQIDDKESLVTADKIDEIIPEELKNSPVEELPPEDDSIVENIEQVNNLEAKESPEIPEMIIENSHQVSPVDSTNEETTWTTEDVIEETIICEEMEVESNSVENTEYIEPDSNVVLEQVLVMDESNYEGKNVVYVIQNEDGTESMVMPTSDEIPSDDYQETSEYEIIEQGVECLSVVDDNESCENIIASEIQHEICEHTESSESSGDQVEPEKTVNCIPEVDDNEKMIVEDEVVPQEVVTEENLDENPSSNGLSPQQMPEEAPKTPVKVDRRRKLRVTKDKLNKIPVNSDVNQDDTTITLQEGVETSVELLEDSSSSNLDFSSTNPSVSSSELLQTDDNPELLASVSPTILPQEDSEDNSNQVSRTPSPTLENTNMVTTPETLQNAEELSRESEIELKPYPDEGKFSSSSDNSNDTVSLSLKTLESNDKSPGQLDPDKKLLFRSRSGSTDTTGSESGSNSSAVRRSSRIRSQGLMKQRSRGRGLVTKPIADMTKALQQERDKLQATTTPTHDTPDSQSETQSDKENNKLIPSDPNTPLGLVPGYDSDSTKPVKVKSRWRRSSELEMGSNTSRLGYNVLTSTSSSNETILPSVPENSVSSSSISSESESVNSSTIGHNSSSPVPKIHQRIPSPDETDKEMEERLSQFECIKENLYLTERYTNKETKRMTCDCFLTEEELERGEMGCGEDCLNRLLMIECGPRCNINSRCTNKRFQNCEYAKCEVFRTEKKGFGLRAIEDLGPGDFIMEYVGEVLDPKDFRKRAKEYSKDKNIHYYFMALKSDQIIDATMKGNISRFINHSCDPNAETQKWTVNGELRIGFFNRRFVAAGEEITFDYHFQRYGKEAQKCYCEASSCRGWIGDTPDEEKEKTDKKEKRERDDKKKKREVKKLYMEDEDLEEEIDKLCSCGLKNRTHTLALSRLMVRSREMDHRSRLLKVLQSGVEACRRLFLDYHGLRLIWSYMMDVTGLQTDEAQTFRLELLKTLNTLPIPNKTLLMDSKVFAVVDKWSKEISISPKSQSSIDESNKPKVVDEEVENNCDSNDKMELDKTKSLDKSSPVDKDGVPEASHTPPVESDIVKMIIELALEILTKWSTLKEVFRIPKKERIEQMKEHEREADIGYKEDSEKEERRTTSGYERHRTSYERRERIDRRRGRDSPEPESYRNKDKERSNLVAIPRLSKYERRQLFAMKVAKQEEERIRRQQQEAFQHHESKCIALGLDPMATPMCDPQTGYPLFFNPNIGQWQGFPIHEGSDMHNPMYIGHSPITGAIQGPNLNPHVNHPSVHQVPPMTPNVHQVPPGMTPDISPAIPPPVYGMNQPGFPPPGAPYPGIPQQVPQVYDNHMLNNLVPVHNGTPPVVITGPSLYVDKPGEVIATSMTATPMETAEEDVEAPQPEIPPLDLPPKWKCAKDSRGRYYYYHVKERTSQWLPPPPTHIGVQPESSSSSESSEESSSSEEDDDTEDGGEDNRNDEGEVVGVAEVEKSKGLRGDPRTPVGSAPEAKKRRDGLVQERIISPRREEDRVDHKKYKDIKDKLKRQKERGKLKEHIDKIRKHRRANKAKSQARHTASKLQAIAQSNELTAERKIKDSFRVNMATVIVKFLNPYRQNDCKQGRITNTEDFKYLARKLTHFVMAKELKHCKSVDELQCNENVKHKAKDFVRKYMNKFGPIYQRSSDDD